jgi:hypothetical protein
VAAPTRDDALLMVQLARWGTELGVQDAIARIFADDFDPDSADTLIDHECAACFYSASRSARSPSTTC